ncbi:MAG TPA: alpha-L-fucosidase [Phycisphaerae bacterium]|nr:alpha-L-fucosidase [Phycisphaerae bacterium]
MSLGANAATCPDGGEKKGHQRLSLSQLRRWEALGYGMFIHFGMSTFVENELPDGKAPATTYAPDRLDVDQWVSVARDAGMKYIVLTAKHVAGHCLWPSKHTKYTVANSADKTDAIEKFVKACEKRGIMAGLYYCSWDNHNRFGSRTPSDEEIAEALPSGEERKLGPFTTSLYQEFQTAQLTELLTQYGPIGETWIDIPGVLGRGYRTYLYEYVSSLQPETVIMMNSGISMQETYPVAYAWPSDIIAIERRLPPDKGHEKWREIEGKAYYMPGEVCDPIGKHWFWVPNDPPRPDEELRDQYLSCKQRGVNLLLDVPPDKHGVIPEEHVQALTRLGRHAAGA